MLGDGRHALLAVEREPPNPARIRPGNVGGLLDGVPERQQTAIDAGVVAAVDLADRRDVECGPLRRQQTQDLFGRVRLDRVADLRAGQCGAQCPEVLAHLTKIDAQIRCLGHRSQTSTRRGAVLGAAGQASGCVGNEKCSGGTLGALGFCDESGVVIPSRTSLTSPVRRL